MLIFYTAGAQYISDTDYHSNIGPLGITMSDSIGKINNVYVLGVHINPVELNALGRLDKGHIVSPI